MRWGHLDPTGYTLPGGQPGSLRTRAVPRVTTRWQHRPRGSLGPVPACLAPGARPRRRDFLFVALPVARLPEAWCRGGSAGSAGAGDAAAPQARAGREGRRRACGGDGPAWRPLPPGQHGGRGRLRDVPPSPRGPAGPGGAACRCCELAALAASELSSVHTRFIQALCGCRAADRAGGCRKRWLPLSPSVSCRTGHAQGRGRCFSCLFLAAGSGLRSCGIFPASALFSRLS